MKRRSSVGILQSTLHYWTIFVRMSKLLKTRAVRSKESSSFDVLALSIRRFDSSILVALLSGYPWRPEFVSNVDEMWLEDCIHLYTSVHWAPSKRTIRFCISADTYDLMNAFFSFLRKGQCYVSSLNCVALLLCCGAKCVGNRIWL